MIPAAEDVSCTIATNVVCLPGYELLTVIGEGSFGTVYHARQIRLDRQVAIKLLKYDVDRDTTVSARFDAETLTHGKLQHSNIVQIFDCGWADKRQYLVMELLVGEDLGKRLSRDGAVPESFAWEIVRQTASALAYASSLGIIHRDIKPENLFLVAGTNTPCIKVMDFGLAIASAYDTPIHDRLTAAGVVIGTPRYMAPEQHRDSHDIDHRADIYALGATAFHALAGYPPFDGKTLWELTGQKLKNTPVFPAGISEPSVALIRSMLDLNPENRPSNYSELIARIDDLSLTIKNVPTTRLRRGHWWRRAILSASVVMALGCLGFLVLPWKVDETTENYVSTSDHRFLFDGESLDGWLNAPSSGGTWLAGFDDEQEPVLQGTGFTRRSFSTSENYRVTIGLDIYESTATEIHFAIPSGNTNGAARLVLRISRSEGAVFGIREGDKGPFRPIGEPVAFPQASWFQDRRPYLEVRVEKTGLRWSVCFNGKLVGTKRISTANLQEFRVFAEERAARIDSVILTPLLRK